MNGYVKGRSYADRERKCEVPILDNWYVLDVRTGQELKIAEALKQRLDSELLFPFVPMFENLFKRAGKVKKEIMPWFPGYLFVETALDESAFVEVFRNEIRYVKGVSHVVGYNGTSEIAVREHEIEGILRLCNDDRCVEASIGFKEGDSVYIASGALKGLESLILEIDGHKRKARIATEFMGNMNENWVGFEYVEKM